MAFEYSRNKSHFANVNSHPISDDIVASNLLSIKVAFDKFIDVDDKSDKDIALLARSFNIDIAVDLAGYTANSRAGIFSYRAAPLQVSYLGYPGTSGAGYMDYIIGDHILIPDSARPFYTEKVA